MTLSPRRGIALLLAVVLAAVLLYYSLRGIEWRDVGALLAQASPWPLVLAAAIVSATLFLRAWRWRILLTAGGDIPMSVAFWATAAGSFGNNFLPARAGELIRTMIVSTRSRFDSAFVLATALSERVADAVALVLITSVVLFAVPNPPDWMSGAARMAALVGLAGAAALVLIPVFELKAKRLMKRLPLAAAASQRLDAAIGSALRGIRAFHDRRRLAGFAAVTIVIWYLDAVGSVLAASALGLDLPLSVALLLIAGLSVGSALPSTPGYVGIYQFVAVTVLTPFGFSRADAIAFILVAQVLTYVVIGAYGAIGLLKFRTA